MWSTWRTHSTFSPPVACPAGAPAAPHPGAPPKLFFPSQKKPVGADPPTTPPAAEILRGTLKPDGSPDSKSFRVVETIPGALLGEYRTADKVQITNRITADELRASHDPALAYRVRTRASRTRASADSHTAIVLIRP